MTPPPANPRPPTASRRRFWKWAAGLAAAGILAGGVYPFLEPSWIEITQTTVPVPRLPEPFDGLRVALLTDVHLGPHTGIDFVRRIVTMTNALAPDLVLLGGDYVHGKTGEDFSAPCLQALDRLTAPLGVWSVPGNHDYWENIRRYRAALAATQIGDLCNRGVWLARGGERLRLCGVDDLWCGRPNLAAALGDCSPADAALLLCHHPDFIETLTDPRVSLALAGHMHGGQVLLPLLHPRVPSRYGAKYLKGLIQGPATRVYVSRGLGTVSLPCRFRARPEIALLTLSRLPIQA